MGIIVPFIIVAVAASLIATYYKRKKKQTCCTGCCAPFGLDYFKKHSDKSPVVPEAENKSLLKNEGAKSEIDVSMVNDMV